MLPTPTIFMVAMGGLALLSVVVVVSTGSFFSLLVVLILIGILGYTLFKMGYLTIETSPGGLNIGFFEKTPVPNSIPSGVLPTASLEKKEVFYVGGSDYVYDEAAAVCAAYDSELASYDQVGDAYASGAEWCSYGWTQGGMALFPTQTKTWQALQGEMDASKRTGCGRPGINGGYFDPANKFGANCYGVKPKSPNDKKFPLPVPRTDSSSFKNMVDKFKGLLNDMNISSFNRVGWSKWDSSTFKMPEITK